jgi:hypothetical protein
MERLFCSTRGVSKSMELSHSWEANGFSAGQEITRILWKPKVHYHAHNIPPLTLIHLNQIHTLLTYTRSFNFNIVRPSMSRSSTWSLSFRFPHQNPVCISPLSHTGHMSRPVRLLVAWSVQTHAVEEPQTNWLLYSSIWIQCSLVTATATVQMPKVLLISDFLFFVWISFTYLSVTGNTGFVPVRVQFTL